MAQGEGKRRIYFKIFKILDINLKIILMSYQNNYIYKYI